MAPRVGDKVIMTTIVNEIFHGIVDYVGPRYIELTKIYCQELDSHLDGNQTFYNEDIADIHTIDKGETLQNGDLDSTLPTTTSCSTSSRTSSSEQCEVKKILMDPAYFEFLRETTLNYIYIDTFGKEFVKALDVLSNAESVGVVGLGDTKHFRTLNLLLMCNFEQVYIFDMKVLKKIDDFVNIFESNFISKVVYNGHYLYSALYQKYQIKMNNFLDLQISASVLTPNRPNMSLAESLEYYFNFPLSLISAAEDEENHRSWKERPLTKGSKVLAAQLAAYLLPLRDKLMKIILKPHTEAMFTVYKKFGNAVSPNRIVDRNSF